MLEVPSYSRVIRAQLQGFTCWVALDDRLVVHLEGGITPAAGKAHHMVLAIAHKDCWLIYGDVISANIEDDTDFSLLLKEKAKK